jgi:hypothetical protein
VNVPEPSLPKIVTWYWSIGLSPGMAACQLATSVSFVPVGSGFVQLAVTPVGAEGGTDATNVVTATGAEAALDPLMVVVTIVI